MRGTLQRILLPLVLATTAAASEDEKRTFSFNSFAPTLWGPAPSKTLSDQHHTSSPKPTTAGGPFRNGTTTGTAPTATATATTTATPYKLQVPPLDTPWTDKVGLNPWPEHPRPQLKRERWQTLNGLWTWQSVGTGNTTNVTLGSSVPLGPLEHEVLVPFCIESALSGLQDLNTTAMWYETTFKVPSSWGGQNVVLNLEAVDYEHTVYINGRQASFFRGGYFRNSVDVTRYLRSNGTNEL